MNYLTRTAEPKDIPSITVIYNQAIEDRTAALETALTTEEERNAWLFSRDPKFSVLIIENENGEVLGWASLNKFKTKCCCSGVVDFSIYIKRETRGMGLGKILLDSLIHTAENHGFSKLVLSALNSNLVAKRLYSSMDFREVGVYEKHAFQNGEWVDVVIMEKLLSERIPYGCV
jgi:L-amino acid N-acyltransferase YncA